MKTIVIVFLTLLAVSVSGQSLLDNPDYKKALELQALAEEAHAEGNYDQAFEYSQEAKIYIEKSNAWIAKRMLTYRANGWLGKANNRMSYLESVGVNPDFQDILDQAAKDIAVARQAYTDEEYEKTIQYAQKVLNNLAPVTTEMLLPKTYRVRLIPGDRDCLNKIAGYPFVYNDRSQWPKLYEANRDKLRYSDNPHLIFPDQVFVIPSLSGEKRVGEYDPDLKYPTYGR
jgi:tetratricopeptide (TPR) repeat protein